ncbi:hypothetical protein FOH10_07550 [Nocardia otitidiscaviarum]|uniref:Uncharacterized protein n=1 Tax=Nocardia otitidiscaviarum TaxID=1823 RepID=A0A516NI80_9NOCA|nr:hypothetical protein [Nocardia otitidiscaviarum]MCP9625289.1 hypothetical protein [Nocardia otitidiscaviarum]QDP78618.1 hypothetical protein FOH10_07550 [Nocardia otitidiscaviarum]
MCGETCCHTWRFSARLFSVAVGVKVVGAIFRRVLLVGVVVVFGAACAVLPTEPPPPVRLGAAPVTATGPRYEGAPLHSSGFYEFDQWPKACNLITDTDIRAIFPQVTDTERFAVHQDLMLTAPLSALEPPEPEWARERVRVGGALCTVAMALPGIAFEADELPPRSGAEVTIEVIAAGSAGVVYRNRPQPFPADPPITVAGIPCVAAQGNSLVCATLYVLFQVSMTVEYTRQVDEYTAIRYLHGTETVAFGREPDKDELRRQREWERSVIVRELVEAVVAKL